jgi:hypothetical protein
MPKNKTTFSNSDRSPNVRMFTGNRTSENIGRIMRDVRKIAPSTIGIFCGFSPIVIVGTRENAMKKAIIEIIKTLR